MYLQGKAKEQMTYDAIVVGSGISGGWAAKELCEKGLKVLMLERGRDIKHVSGYETAMKNPWDFPHRGKVDSMAREQYWASVRTGYTANEEHRHHFENDKENPYKETRAFDWIRGYHVGGRSLMWGRQSYRWNEKDFTANSEDGHGIDWPIRYKDLAPWYSYVESFIGVSGYKEGLDVLPDGSFQPGMEMNCVEKDFRGVVKKKFGRPITIGRTAHLTAPTKIQTDLGRSSCQYRNACMRGCPYGAYFSTQSSTLPAANNTGNLTLIPDKICYEVIFDDEKGKATGVRVIDQNTKQTEEYYGKIIFLNASAINSAWIMMQSKSKTHPNGLGNESDQLGRNIMDHHLAAGASGDIEGYENDYYYGRRANGIYVPRFANWTGDQKKRDFVRGFGYQGGASRSSWGRGVGQDGFGADFKESMTVPGPWSLNIGGFGETVPDSSNRFTLSSEKDKWGLPIVDFDSAWGENAIRMRKAMVQEAVDMLEAMGAKNISPYDDMSKNPGIGIHEMGTARMGKEAKTSCLNANNQVWGAENVFVTDGAAMVSASCVNPSLTYMALTARAADFAVKELKKQNL